jgi:putative effector of murein hydrolase
MKGTALLIFCVALTVGAYALSRLLAKRYPSPLTTPVFFSTSLIIAVLCVSGIDYRDYEPAKNVMILLLGPATVALAVPIFKNRATLRAHAVPALLGIGIGCIVTVLAALLLSNVLQFGTEVTRSMSVKSVTAPIAIELATIIRGNPALAACFVIATGMIGTMLGPWLLTRASG